MEENEGEVFKHPDGYLVVKSDQREGGLFSQKTGKVNLFSLEAKNFAGVLTPEIESQLESIGIFSIYD
jgi:hypothetical protein